MADSNKNSDSTTINISNEDGIAMFDAMSRINVNRCIKPLDRDDYIEYPHRGYYDEYSLIIGDVYIMIPPTFIHVQSESHSQNIQTLRQANSMKEKTGYHRRYIQIDLVFNGMDEINGFKVPAPKHKDGNETTSYYYVDGLRTLLSEFKFTPFLPIDNDLLKSYGIYTVALENITISTIPGFQNALAAHLELFEVNMTPYIEMPDRMFNEIIDWDLFRYYTQSFLTRNHIYGKLQELPVNKDHTKFKISLIKPAIVAAATDTTDGVTKEETMIQQIVNPDNYDVIIDSGEADVHIVDFQCAYSNMLTSIQMSNSPSPTLQYLGGLDTRFGITMETTDVNVVTKLEQCQIDNDQMVRNNPKMRGTIGFVKIESDFVTFCGSLYVTIESVESYTIQEMPGLFDIRFTCVSFDITQSRREDLNGFIPFDGQVSTLDDLNIQSNEELNNKFNINTTQAIGQSYDGLMKKIYQDNYAEAMLRETMEVYPDLRLPTYDEVDDAITNIIAFRKANKLTQLEYTKYPRQPNFLAYGHKETITKTTNEYIDNGGENIVIDLDGTNAQDYNGFVDPDFYVFYPNTYMSLYKQDPDLFMGNETKAKKQTKTVKTEEQRNYSKYASEDDMENRQAQFVGILKDKVGKDFAISSEGDIVDSNGRCYDSMGVITSALKQMGILPDDCEKLTYNDFKTMDIFDEVR